MTVQRAYSLTRSQGGTLLAFWFSNTGVRDLPSHDSTEIHFFPINQKMEKTQQKRD
jgi:hypothetical protein